MDHNADAVKHIVMTAKADVVIPAAFERIQPESPMPPRNTKIAVTNIKNPPMLSESNSGRISFSSAVAANDKTETINEYVNSTVEIEKTMMHAVTSLLLFSVTRNWIPAVKAEACQQASQCGERACLCQIIFYGHVFSKRRIFQTDRLLDANYNGSFAGTVDSVFFRRLHSPKLAEEQ